MIRSKSRECQIWLAKTPARLFDDIGVHSALFLRLRQSWFYRAVDGESVHDSGRHPSSRDGSCYAAHAMVCSNLRFSDSPAASCLVNSAAGSSRARRAAWPDHNGVKSAEPAISDLMRRGTRVAAASGKPGTTSDMGPTSRSRRFTTARAGRPVNTLVTAV